MHYYYTIAKSLQFDTVYRVYIIIGEHIFKVADYPITPDEAEILNTILTMFIITNYKLIFF